MTFRAMSKREAPPCRAERRLLLLILDGLGLGEPGPYNAVWQAATPNLCWLRQNAFYTTLEASGPAVGLTHGQMGNSNVGHLHIAAGRVLLHDAVRIDRAIQQDAFCDHHVLRAFFSQIRARTGALHLMGLISDGRVHSDIRHVLSAVDCAGRHGIEKGYIHVFLDGRDVSPKSAATYLTMLREKLCNVPGFTIATVMGRYYAMDRDQRWKRTDRARAAIFSEAGCHYQTADEALNAAYARGETDEFVLPSIIDGYRGVQPDRDGFFSLNFRADRMRQLIRVIKAEMETIEDADGIGDVSPILTMTQYDPALGLPVLFAPPKPTQTLGEVVSRAGCSQYRLAETEKYAHVTYFFNGGREAPFPGESRCLIPSPSVATYDMCPKMSAEKVTQKLLHAVKADDWPLIVANYANCDMVGHTGDFEAAVCAVEKIDDSLGHVIKGIQQAGVMLLVVSDHGNVEKMQNESGRHTAHTANRVPCFLLDPDGSLNDKGILRAGSLIDVAPTVLKLMGLSVPKEMTGSNLLSYDFNQKEEDGL